MTWLILGVIVYFVGRWLHVELGLGSCVGWTKVHRFGKWVEGPNASTGEINRARICQACGYVKRESVGWRVVTKDKEKDDGDWWKKGPPTRN